MATLLSLRTAALARRFADWKIALRQRLLKHLKKLPAGTTKRLSKAVSGAVTANGTAEDPKGCAEKVAHQIFPNTLPYTVDTPAVFGFADWNGRSLTDNA